MVEFSIVLVFAGLVAFLPNSISHPDFMTAYLVNDAEHSGHCKHEPILWILGESVIEKGSGCQSVEENQSTLKCPLSFTDVSLRPATNEKPNFIRLTPQGKQPKDRAEGSDVGWLVRMANVEPASGRIKDWTDLEREGLVGARFQFGWESARTCKLDDDGRDHVHAFQFEAGQHLSNHEQALAERVLFKAKVDAGIVRLILHDRKGSGEDTVIRLKCPNGICPQIIVENEVDEYCKEEEHFHMYYALARDKKFTSIPVRTGPYKIEQEVSDECSFLDEQSPGTSSANTSKLASARKLEVDADGPVFGPKPDNRIICPPVFFNP